MVAQTSTQSTSTAAAPAGAILVTGGAGFIGSHTAESLLSQGHAVVVVDEMNDYYDLRQKQANLDILAQTAARSGAFYRFFRGSCEDASFMARVFDESPVRIDRVCHLAARAGVRPSIQDPHLYVQANITATLTLLELARQHKIANFVYASSSSVYGQNAKVPFAESDRTDSPACELLASTYSHLYGIPVTGLRFFTVYGPRGRPDMAPFMFVDRISRGIPINQFGDGTSCRDYTYISDIVAGIEAALARPSPTPAVFNLGNSATVSLSEFIAVIEESVGREAVIRRLPDQPGDVPRTFADLTLSSAVLGYKPTTDIRTGMRQFVQWYAAYRAAECKAAAAAAVDAADSSASSVSGDSDSGISDRDLLDRDLEASDAASDKLDVNGSVVDRPVQHARSPSPSDTSSVPDSNISSSSSAMVSA
ncbi:hypothetical protein BC831DRAFT_466558 [Entophlyctis helioformis]|nr:hypothetical protein BC831DRAFT_466558 [Entophlyctis helioformis]